MIMKKCLAISLIFIMIISVLTIIPVGAKTGGDVNGDGKLNAKDVTTIMKHLIGNTLSSFDVTAADFNNDGKVNAKDVTSLMKALVSTKADSNDFTDAYSAYLRILSDNKKTIDANNWESNRGESLGHGTMISPVVFSDVYGDETPEMIYLSETRWMNYPIISLNIVTYENGKSKTLYFNEHYFGGPAAGGIYSLFFFRLKGEKTLRVCELSNDDWVKTEYSEFKEQNGALVKVETLKRFSYYSGIVNGTMKTKTDYSRYGSPISEKEYEADVSSMKAKIETILLTNNLKDDFAAETIARNGYPAMSCDEAITHLRGIIGSSSETDSDVDKPVDEDLFSAIAGRYVFSTGVGAWSTVLLIAPDGTFTGSYYDTMNQGYAPSGYADLVYRAEFHGNVVNLRKENNYTYVFEIGNFVYDTVTGTKEEGYLGNDFVLYYNTTALGVSGGVAFYYYGEGAPTNELPDYFIQGLKLFGFSGSEPHTTRAGLYNITTKEAFISLPR